MKKPLAFNYFKIILIILNCFSVKTTLCQSFRGISPISENEAWFSGSKGSVFFTKNGGKSFDTLSPSKFNKKDFRDIHAIDQNNAVVLSAGDSAVILKTYNHGQSWNTVYQDNRPGIFLDVLEINNKTGVGIALGDPLHDSLFNSNNKNSNSKHFVALWTPDFGNHWYPIPNGAWNLATPTLSSMFAASGTSLVYNKLEFDQTKKNWTIFMDFYFAGGGDSAADVRQVLLSFEMKNPQQTFQFLKFDHHLKFPYGEGWGIYGMQKLNQRIFCFGGHWKYPNTRDSFCYVIQLSNVEYTLGKQKIKSSLATSSFQFPQNGYRSGGALIFNHQTNVFSGISVGSNGFDLIQMTGIKSKKLKSPESMSKIKGLNVCVNVGNVFWMAGNNGQILRKTTQELLMSQ